MKIDGGCHCGAIRYEADVDPEKVVICHCTDCQELTGTAYRVTAPSAEADFRIMAGEPAVYVKTTAESGNPRAMGFCANCGSHLYAVNVDPGPKIYGIRLGTARQRHQLPPKRQIWHQSALEWVDSIGDLPASEKI